MRMFFYGLVLIVTSSLFASSFVNSSKNEGIPCEREIGLLCPKGSFDGCEVEGLTNVHICVANIDRDNSAEPCEQEIARLCDEGFTDACGLDPRPAKTHICVQE